LKRAEPQTYWKAFLFSLIEHFLDIMDNSLLIKAAIAVTILLVVTGIIVKYRDASGWSGYSY